MLRAGASALACWYADDVGYVSKIRKAVVKLRSESLGLVPVRYGAMYVMLKVDGDWAINWRMAEGNQTPG